MKIDVLKILNELKIAVLTSRFPYPLEKGDKLRIYHQVKQLSKNNNVLLICLSDYPMHDDAKKHFEKIGVNVRIIELSKFNRAVSIVGSIWSNIPFQVSYYYSKKANDYILKLIEEFSPDILYCHLLRVAPYVLKHNIPKVIDYMDAFGYSMGRRANLSSCPLNIMYRNEAKRMTKYEQFLAKYFDAWTIISEQDRKRLNFPEASDFKVISNGVDLDFFTPKSSGNTIYDVGFVGNLGYLPNIEAAHYLVDNIMPGLKGYKALICGARPAQSLIGVVSDNIKVEGYIEDIRDGYNQIKILVAPLFSGTGQQNKILEAMAMGVPSITTKEVNNAIGAIPGKDILIANDVKEFQEKIKLLSSNNDLYQEIRNNAITFVHENYSWESSVTELTQVFKKIVNK